jgi:hypothetical protein
VSLRAVSQFDTTSAEPRLVVLSARHYSFSLRQGVDFKGNRGKVT